MSLTKEEFIKKLEYLGSKEYAAAEQKHLKRSMAIQEAQFKEIFKTLKIIKLDWENISFFTEFDGRGIS